MNARACGAGHDGGPRSARYWNDLAESTRGRVELHQAELEERTAFAAPGNCGPPMNLAWPSGGCAERLPDRRLARTGERFASRMSEQTGERQPMWRNTVTSAPHAAPRARVYRTRAPSPDNGPA